MRNKASGTSFRFTCCCSIINPVDHVVCIVSAVDNMNNMNTQIANAATEQTTVAEGISRNIVNISTISSETLDGSKKTAEVSHSMQETADNLQELVCEFKTT